MQCRLCEICGNLIVNGDVCGWCNDAERTVINKFLEPGEARVRPPKKTSPSPTVAISHSTVNIAFKL